MGKIAIVTPYLSGQGGTERVIATLLSNSDFFLEQHDIHVIVLGSSDNHAWVSQVSHAVKIQFDSANDYVKAAQLTASLIIQRYDTVICMSTSSLKFVSRLRQKLHLKLKLLSWIHYSLFNEKTVDPRALFLSDRCLAISSGIQEQLLSLGIPASQVSLVYNPVIPATHQILKSTDGVIHLVYIGRIMLDGQKNLRELLDALKKLPANTVQVDLFGIGEIALCKAYAFQVSVKQKMIWHGWVRNPWREIKTADALVLTSKFEGFPMVLLEALSYGLPCISSDCPTGPEDVLHDGVNGYLYSSGNSNQLAKLIQSIRKKPFNRDLVVRSVEKFYVKNFVQIFWDKVIHGETK
ncbi:MAG: glycosyltransferase [Lactobacillus sp.]|nr:glycosyltransferase [Lactobacillus sp.]